MVDEPLVSVVIPAYNHEKFVGQCIESIINQSYKNIELIVIDDGSKDETYSIIKLYDEKCKKRFVNYIYLTKQNEGVCKTLNHGIKISNGQFVTCIASDDFFLEDKVKKQVQAMKDSKNTMMTWTNGYDFDNDDINNKTLMYRTYPECMKKNNYDTFIYLVVIGNKINNVSCMYRKELFDYIGYFDEKINFEDWDFYIRVAFKFNIMYINEPLTMKRNHDNNTMKRTYFMFDGDKQTLTKTFEQLNFNNKEKVKKLAYSNMYLRNAKVFYECEDKKMHWFCLKMSFFNMPLNKLLYKYLLINKPIIILKKLIEKYLGEECYNNIKKIKDKM